MCLNLCNPMNWSLSGCSVHGILQSRALELVALSFSGRSSQAKDQIQVPALQADSLPSEPPGKLFWFLNCDPLQCLYWKSIIFSEVSPLWPIRMLVSQYCLISWLSGHLTASQYLFPAGPYGVESFVFIALNPWVFIALNPWLPVQISRASFLCHSLFPAILFHIFSHLSGHIFVHFLLTSSGQKKYTCVLPSCPAICKVFSGQKLELSWYPSISYHRLIHSVSNTWKLCTAL